MRVEFTAPNIVQLFLNGHLRTSGNWGLESLFMGLVSLVNAMA